MDEPQPPDIEDVLAELHEDARGRVKEELLPGERLLWAARSHQDPFRPGGYVVAALVIVVLAGGAFFALRHAFATDRVGSPADTLVGLGILLAVVATVASIATIANLKGAMNKRWTRSQHLYAITNRRVILRTPTFDRLGIQVRTVDLPGIVNIHRTEYPDRLGTLSFSIEGAGPKVVDPEHGAYEPIETYMMEKIPDIRRVELLLRQTVSEFRSQQADHATPKGLA